MRLRRRNVGGEFAATQSAPRHALHRRQTTLFRRSRCCCGQPWPCRFLPQVPPVVVVDAPEVPFTIDDFADSWNGPTRVFSAFTFGQLHRGWGDQ